MEANELELESTEDYAQVADKNNSFTNGENPVDPELEVDGEESLSLLKEQDSPEDSVEAEEAVIDIDSTGKSLTPAESTSVAPDLDIGPVDGPKEEYSVAENRTDLKECLPAKMDIGSTLLTKFRV
jgi:hypothetical protein